MGSPISRALLFLILAGALTTYSFWIYHRIELAVPAARRLAIVRSVTLVLVLLLLFDPRLPMSTTGGGSGRWILLDASLSMTATGADDTTPSAGARARAQELKDQGWTVVQFGNGRVTTHADGDGSTHDGLVSELAPVLRTAAESGAREVRVLSDMRFTDRVAIQATLEELPVSVEFEDMSRTTWNAGIGRLTVTDVRQPSDRPNAEIEVFGGVPGDSLAVEIYEEDQLVARVAAVAPAAGLRATASIELPAASESGRRRYVARVAGESDDGFASDDEAVTYANIGYEAGALVLVSAVPDWEPRYLLPVLADVTGLPSAGYLRVGPDRFVTLGAASDRGVPVDSATVRRAAADAALLVMHGLSSDTEPWMTTITGRAGRRLVLPSDAAGAAAVGLVTGGPEGGEWYASPDVPTSPIAGALAGVDLQGLPPLSGVMIPEVRSSLPPLQVQLRGAGTPESAFGLVDRDDGRVAVALASGFWRWAMRQQGHEAYRRIWSGVAGWLLADEQVVAAEPRPSEWVFARGEEVAWSVGGDSMSLRIIVEGVSGVVTDTTLQGGASTTTPALAPGAYGYVVEAERGDTISSGRFDVAEGSLEMLPAAEVPELPLELNTVADMGDRLGRPIRTSPWPYLLLIMLLCGEWVVRRRSGLR